MLLIDLPLFAIFMNRSVQQHAAATQRRLIDLCAIHSLQSTTTEPAPAIHAKPLVSDDDRFVFMTRLPQDDKYDDPLDYLVAQTFLSGRAHNEKIGKIMGLLHPQTEQLIFSWPVHHKDTIVAAGGIQTSLAPIYQRFRRLHVITLVFVLINSFFFALFGNRQLSRIYFQPLKRLAKKAESFQDEETLFFSVRKEDNEFSILSSSLNKMVHRINENKQTLTDNIESLKKANIEIQKAHRDVIRAEKLATVGRLTSGIAHEIGNPIGIVLGYLDLMKQSDIGEDERVDFISRSEMEITRINGIIRQLLDMSRPGTGEQIKVSIRSILHELVDVFKYQSYAATIDFIEKYDSSKDVVFADPDQLRQVFLNILLNAVDAVNTVPDHAPIIKIGTDQTSETDNDPESSRMIRIIIRDNGPGIDHSHLERIFDPFFTTKPPGKGTGLGLSVSFMIVDKLGGRLSVSSKAHQGAEFVVLLPLLMENQSAGKAGELI